MYDMERMEDEMGDIFFATVNYARWHKIDAEQGQAIDIDTVVLVSDGDNVSVGAPYVKGAVVKATEYANSVPNYHTYTYDIFGNVLSHSLWASGIDTVTTTYTYDATHRFISEEKSNTSGISMTYTYNELDLPTKTSKLLDGSTIEYEQYTYDNIGRRTSVKTYPQVTTSTYTYGWGSSAKKRYYIKEECTASPYVVTWYDNVNRPVLTETLGEDSVLITKEKLYDRNGKIGKITSTTGNTSHNVLYSYDFLERISMEHSSMGTDKIYVYENMKVKEFGTIPAMTKTFDEWGNIKTITDVDGASVQYTYNSNGNAEKIVAEPCSRWNTMPKVSRLR